MRSANSATNAPAAIDEVKRPMNSTWNSAETGEPAPVKPARCLGLGASCQLSRAVNINAAYEFLWAGDMPVTQGTDASLRGRVSGSYNDGWLSFATVNRTWKF